MTAAKLVTIPFSHYADKARWALNHYGVAYDEACYLPLFHLPGVAWSTRLRLGRRDAISSPFSTPVLIAADKTVVHDSSAIARWATDAFGDETTTLYPAEYREAIATIEREVHDRLGPHTRRWAYHQIMNASDDVVAEIIGGNVGASQRLAFRASRPVWMATMRRILKINEVSAARSLARVREVFDAYLPRVAEREFLLGDRLTAADVSLATMAAPAIGVTAADGYGAKMPALSDMPEATRAVVEELRGHPVGQFALQTYRRHRNAPQRPRDAA